jgi:hypothetical protein
VSVALTDPTWREVVAWVTRRRAELVDDLDSLNIDETSRRDAAVRRDELLIVLGIPIVISSEKAEKTATPPRSQY